MDLGPLAHRDNQNLASKYALIGGGRLEEMPVLNIIEKRETVQQQQSMFITIFPSSAPHIDLRMIS
jgi:hypothetical protein